jgi:hypothetical protein
MLINWLSESIFPFFSMLIYAEITHLLLYSFFSRLLLLADCVVALRERHKLNDNALAVKRRR